MHEDIYDRLRQTAAARRTLAYGDIAPLAGLNMGRQDHRSRIGKILDDISISEHEAGRPLLSAVVVQSGEGIPGKGFFKMARSLGLMRPSEGTTSFFAAELNRVFDAWAKDA